MLKLLLTSSPTFQLLLKNKGLIIFRNLILITNLYLMQFHIYHYIFYMIIILFYFIFLRACSLTPNPSSSYFPFNQNFSNIANIIPARSPLGLVCVSLRYSLIYKYSIKFNVNFINILMCVCVFLKDHLIN